MVPSASPQPPGQPAAFPAPLGSFTASVPPPPMPDEVKTLLAWSQLPNVATEIDEETLGHLSQQVHEGYTRDLASRSEWEEIADRAMRAAKQTRQGKNYPFPNASNVRYPLVAIAAMQFNARAYPAICNGRQLVRAKIGGSDPQGLKASRAERVSEFMSHQIADGMPGWEHEMDSLLLAAPILGSAFKKTYYDQGLRKPCTSMISAFDLVVNCSATSILTCPRITHRFELYPYEIDERQRDGRFLPVDVSGEYTGDETEQAPILIIEQHCFYDLDDDGLMEPWVVTMTEQQGTLLRITPGFDVMEIVHDGDKITRIPRDNYFAPFNFMPNPDGGFYGIGFGHLLDSFSEVINSSFNAIMDAAHLQNAGGGFIGAGLDFQSEQEEFRFEPGKYYTVTNDANDISSNIVTVQHPGPSSVLFQLLQMMQEDAKVMVSTQDILTGAGSAQNMQPTTLMALIDQGLRQFTAIYKRIYDALSYEFRILYNLNRRYLTDEEYSAYLGNPASVQQDFADDGCLVVPVADPNSVTMAQKMAQAGFLATLLEHPQFGQKCNVDVILRRVLEAGSIDNPQEVILPPPPPTPADQIPVMAEMAGIKKTESEAAHNFALAEAEGARAEHFRAKTADVIMNHQPDFLQNPPISPG